ncbi:hypothetical protein H6G06_11755 [Anabaena sphaerica FACHB-251]|uniref:Uncharacterized protein n=1 Tax=Anabaena sphaerica FACHB-251 TaxID=2692883 RepID=A0A926WIN0_9NOST|nr:hypothetical protein [Anabaena sphaerica]MBD2294146.1 hypothetical protein [Anabaena sphaerica FACHB-251]
MMSTQINKSHLVELSTEEQQLISGGYGNCSPCYQPRQGCGYKPHSQGCGYKPHSQGCGYKPQYGGMPYQDYGYSPEYC